MICCGPIQWEDRPAHIYLDDTPASPSSAFCANFALGKCPADGHCWYRHPTAGYAPTAASSFRRAPAPQAPVRIPKYPNRNSDEPEPGIPQHWLLPAPDGMQYSTCTLYRCAQFWEGRCSKGNECLYSHEGSLADRLHVHRSRSNHLTPVMGERERDTDEEDQDSATSSSGASSAQERD